MKTGARTIPPVISPPGATGRTSHLARGGGVAVSRLGVHVASHVTIGPVTFPGTGGISADVAVIGVGGIAPHAVVAS